MVQESQRPLKCERRMTSPPMPLTFRQFEQEGNFCQHVSLDAFGQVIPGTSSRRYCQQVVLLGSGTAA
jgi:hypothetical protein